MTPHQRPPFKKALLSALLAFICQFWTHEQAISKPINFKEIK